MSVHLISYFVFSYLIGSIPFGYLIFYFSEKKDVRQFGSGNIGATNLMRTKGKTAGLITLLLDILKAVLIVVYGKMHFSEGDIVLAGLLVIAGHMFPVFLGFKGGKGVASCCGFFLVFDWRLFLVFLITFLITLGISRFVSLSSLSGCVMLFFASLVLKTAEISSIVLIIVILIIARHQANIKRLLSGEEHQFKWKKS